VRAGVLLYALAISLIFSLVLQAYLQAQVDNAKNLRAEKNYLTAQVLATVAKEHAVKSLKTDQGTVQQSGDKLTVVLTDGSRYDF